MPCFCNVPVCAQELLCLCYSEEFCMRFVPNSLGCLQDISSSCVPNLHHAFMI